MSIIGGLAFEVRQRGKRLDEIEDARPTSRIGRPTVSRKDPNQKDFGPTATRYAGSGPRLKVLPLSIQIRNLTFLTRSRRGLFASPLTYRPDRRADVCDAANWGPLRRPLGDSGMALLAPDASK